MLGIQTREHLARVASYLATHHNFQSVWETKLGLGEGKYTNTAGPLKTPARYSVLCVTIIMYMSMCYVRMLFLCIIIGQYLCMCGILYLNIWVWLSQSCACSLVCILLDRSDVSVASCTTGPQPLAS